MLSYQTVNEHTLELLRQLSSIPEFSAMRLVGGTSLATPPDIAAMKVNAIEGRGSKKDFIDLYYLLQHYTLHEILGFYKQKYPEHSVFRALMSMSYFDDADVQPTPRLFTQVSWEDMKEYIHREIEQYSKG